MPSSITPTKIRTNNRNLIYLYIFNNQGVSQQDIAFDLRLSRPTVTTNLAELEALGMISQSGQIDSDLVGRKATAYTAVYDYRIAIGVNIHKNEIKIIAVDLNGCSFKRTVCKLTFKNTKAYQKNVCKHVLRFIDELSVPSEKILGIGIAMPGLISPDGTYVTYGKILDCTGLKIDVFRDELGFPCRFIHDSEAAATSELWASPDLVDAMYLQINLHVGAAMISDRRITIGKHGQNATIEHIPIVENGKLCYCGQRGCIDTVCSLESLIGEKSVEEFFSLLRKNDENANKEFSKYLHNLAVVVCRMHLVYDKDFIIGGEIAPFLTEDDIAKVNEFAMAQSPFNELLPYVYLSKMPEHNVTIGAALPYIHAFLAQSEIK